MILIRYDLATGTARLAQSTTIKVGADVPVHVVFSADPGDVDSIQLALGPDAATSTVLAYMEVFTQENATTWTGLLDATDSRLAAHMESLTVTILQAELTCVLNGERLVTPNMPVTVQQRILTGPGSTEGGPTYLTEAQIAAGYAAIGHNHNGVYQPLSTVLTALAALATTEFGRALLTMADGPAARAAIGAISQADGDGRYALIGHNHNTAYQSLSTNLTNLASVVSTAYGRGLLALADAAALRSALGLPEIVNVTESTTLGDSYHGKTVTNVGASEYLTHSLDGSPGMEVEIIAEKNPAAGISLTPVTVPFLLGGNEYAGALEAWSFGNWCRVKRTNTHWFVMGYEGFGPAA